MRILGQGYPSFLWSRSPICPGASTIFAVITHFCLLLALPGPKYIPLHFAKPQTNFPTNSCTEPLNHTELCSLDPNNLSCLRARGRGRSGWRVGTDPHETGGQTHPRQRGSDLTSLDGRGGGVSSLPTTEAHLPHPAVLLLGIHLPASGAKGRCLIPFAAALLVKAKG